MCQSPVILAVTLYVTVSPGRASAGVTAVVRATSLGRNRGLLSLWAGLAAAGASATTGAGAATITARTRAQRAGRRRRAIRMTFVPQRRSRKARTGRVLDRRPRTLTS